SMLSTRNICEDTVNLEDGSKNTTDVIAVKEQREAQPSQSRKSHGGRRTPQNSAAYDNEDEDDKDGYDEGPNRDAQARGPRQYSQQRPAATGYGYPGFPEGGRRLAPRGNGNSQRSLRAHISRVLEDELRDERKGGMDARRQASRRQDHRSRARGEEVSRGRPKLANPIRRREETDRGMMNWAEMNEGLLPDPLGEDDMSSSGSRPRHHLQR
ncbi:MAG: hypothetical protein Q9187_009560, partial [Circinaria calcarea]